MISRRIFAGYSFAAIFCALAGVFGDRDRRAGHRRHGGDRTEGDIVYRDGWFLKPTDRV